MKTKLTNHWKRRRQAAALTYIEVLIGAVILLVLFGSFFAALNFGFATARASRENLRATQIMLERMEGLRLFSWDQLTNTTLNPTTFTSYYYPAGLSSGGSQGALYSGTVSVTAAPLTFSPGYAANVRMITVQVTWENCFGQQSTRQMSTYYGHWGMQNYVFGSTNN